MDIVFIRELKVQTVIGAFEWERRIRQTVVLDLEMAADTSKAAASDRLEDALDYKAVADRITGFADTSNFQLVETLAESVAGILQAEFGVTWLRLRVSKPGAVRSARDVGVLIERGRRDG
jgi:7,8-dihydroneopterin aldolase/epimerase/oxygenase